MSEEPGTNLPKIPGSSISGVTRSYTAMAVQSGDPLKKKYQNIVHLPKPDGTIEQKNNSCAGKGADNGEGHCGGHDCEVCVPFGFSKKGNSFQGLAQFFDARILFFSVHSMIGPVWVTCPSVIGAAGIFTDSIKSEDWSKLNNELSKHDPEEKNEYFYSQCQYLTTQNHLNLGWLFLPKKNTIPINGVSIPGVTSWQVKDFNGTSKKLSEVGINTEILNRIIIISDKLFSQIVNDNLEVRTSVAIDPATGAAEDGALFVYEAIPRATVMFFDVVYNKPEYFRINGQDIMKDINSKADAAWIQSNVEKGLNYIETLGIGGMGTRGMGRMKVMNLGGQQ